MNKLVNSNISGVADIRLIRWILFVMFAVVGAIYVGNIIAGGDVSTLAEATLVITGVIMLLYSGNWLIWSFFAISLGFIIAPTSFKISPNEMALLFLGIFVVGCGWRKGFLGIPASLKQLTFFSLVVVSFVIYLLAHSLYNITYPLNNETIAFSNISKTLVQLLIGMMVVWTAINLNRYTTVPKKPYLLITYILMLGVSVNIAIACYDVFVNGVSFAAADTNIGLDNDVTTIINIPGINLFENFFQLRVISPLCIIFSTVLLTSKCPSTKTVAMRIGAPLLLLLGGAGGAMSGGRASLLVPVICALIILIFRRRTTLVLGFAILLVTFVLVAKYSFDINPEYVPAPVQRALALIPGMGFQEAEGSINSSSEWRYELFQMSLTDWEQSYRTVFFGRSIYAYTETDAQQSRLDPYYGEQYVSLRRGATHNLLTDLLVPFGLVGLCFYFFCIFLLMRGLIIYRRKFLNVPMLNDLSMMLLTMVPVNLIYGLLGGNAYTLELGCMTAFYFLLVASHDRPHAIIGKETVTKVFQNLAGRKVKSPFARNY